MMWLPLEETFEVNRDIWTIGTCVEALSWDKALEEGQGDPAVCHYIST